MDFLPPLLSDDDIRAAKKRIWNRVESRLPDRGVSPFQEIVTRLQKEPVEVNRLQKVMMKERLLEKLPDRHHVPLFFNRRLWASMTLSLFVAFFTVPVFTMRNGVQASAVNMLKVVQGDVMVNGIPAGKVTLLKEGDEVLTGVGAMAHVELQDDTRMTLGPRTEVRLADTDNMHIIQEEGRVWTQVINPVSDKSVKLSFPDGEVIASQRSSFDVSVSSDESLVKVAENVVEVKTGGEQHYEGSVGKGTQVAIADEFELQEVSDSEDVWWEFNESYGKTYIAGLEEDYTEQRLASVSMLPDHPLYFLKSWRESVQENIAFSDSAKQELVAKQMETRLNEAQILLDQGKDEKAAEVLVAYQEAVEKSIDLSGADEVESQVEEAQKELLAKLDVEAGDQLIEDALEETSTMMASTPGEKNEVRMMSASQKLARVPSLIELGRYEEALLYLEQYKTDSMSILMQLEEVPMEEREVLVSALLDQKLKDLQMIRVIAAMPEFTEVIDMDAQIVQEMSVMVLSLRERALTRLADFFTTTGYDADAQYALYDSLKGGTVMTAETSLQFEAVEEALEEASEDEVIADIELVEEEEIIDPRFVD